MNLHQKAKMIGLRENAYELANEVSALMGMYRPGVKADEAAVRRAEARALDTVHEIAGKLGFKLVPARSERFERSEVIQAAE